MGLRLGADGARLGVDLGTGLADFLVQRHFGGTDALAATPAPTRARSRPWSSPFSRAAGSRSWAWPSPTPGAAVPPVPDAFATDAETFDLGAPESPVIVAELALAIGDATARLTVAYPAATVHLLLGSQEAAGPPPPAADPASLAAVPVDLRVVLGQTRVPLADLQRLAPGDVIPLPSAPDAPLEVWSGARVRFLARAGVQGRRLAVEIASVSDRSPDR